MPLKNIGKQTIETKYNSVERTLKPGEILDVRDFNIDAGQVPNVERAIQDKYGRENFSVVPSKDKMLEQELAEANKKIDFLESENKALLKEVEELRGAETKEKPKSKKAGDTTT